MSGCVARALVLALALAAPAFGAPADDRRAAARGHYVEGSKFYDTGRYLEAAAEYERAFLLVDDASLLFNMGQAFRLGGDAARALRSYRSYLRRVPDAAERDAVVKRIDELERELDAAKATQAGPPHGTRPLGDAPQSPLVTQSPPPPQSPLTRAPSLPPGALANVAPARRRGPAWWSGVALLSGALGALAAGAGLLGYSATLSPSSAGSLGDFEDARSGRRGLQIGGGVLVGVAALAVAGGVVSLVIWSRSRAGAR